MDRVLSCQHFGAISLFMCVAWLLSGEASFYDVRLKLQPSVSRSDASRSMSILPLSNGSCTTSTTRPLLMWFIYLCGQTHWQSWPGTTAANQSCTLLANCISVIKLSSFQSVSQQRNCSCQSTSYTFHCALRIDSRCHLAFLSHLSTTVLHRVSAIDWKTSQKSTELVAACSRPSTSDALNQFAK